MGGSLVFASRRAQASLEFVVLAVFMLVFFLVVTIGIQSQLSHAQLIRNEELAKQLASIINNEVVLAQQANSGYQRSFYLPAVIEGSDYNLSLVDGVDLVVGFRGVSYVFFLDGNATFSPSPPRPGKNRIAN